MKKMLIVFTLLMAAASSYAFCEYGNKVKEYYEGNHKVAVYDFGQMRLLKFNIPSGMMAPYTIRYDFWQGEVCTN